MSQAEDMDAIDRFMRTTFIDPRNSEAFSIKESWIRWWDSSIRDSWFNKSMSGESYDIARTRRNQFMIANAKPQEREDVRRVITTGQETEDMEGKTKPPIDGQTGRVGTQVKKPTVAATPSTQPTSGQPVAPKQVGSAPVPLGRVLSLGMTDSGKGDIKAWQVFLGIVPATGNFGEATKSKTMDWQRRWNAGHPNDILTVDGKVGNMTWQRAFPPSAPTAPTSDDFAPSPPNPRAADVFAPTPKPSSSKPAPKPSSPKPAPKPAVADAKPTVKEKTKRAAAVVKQAGILDVGTWPLWAKVTGILTIVGAAVAAAMGKKPLRIGT